MAQNLKINGKQYNGVSVIGAPNANGGTARFFDTSNATAEADDIAIGKTAYTINGKITGTNQGGGSTLGTKTITVNGEYDAQDDGYDGYSSVDVQVPGSSPTLQAKTNIAPTTSSQTITADQGYDGLSSVQINAMPTGTAGTPTATKGAVSNHSISVTPSVTNSAGYIASGTINGTAVSVSASELDSGAKSITANGNSQDVVGYASVNVNVPNTYTAGDEGKVVSSGALVAQTAHADVTPTTSDQTIDTTTNNSLKVKGDANLVAGNIKKDVEIFGTTGSYEGGGGGYTAEEIASKTVSGAITINANNVPTIKERAFSGYSGLTSVTIVGSPYLGNYCFENCTGITTLNIDDLTRINSGQWSVATGVFKACNSITMVCLKGYGNNVLPSYNFENCTSITTVDVKTCSGVQDAFKGCTALRTLIIRKSDGVPNMTSPPNNAVTGIYNNPNDSVIYVPNALIASYQTASNWSTLYNLNNNIFQKIEGTTYETHWADGTVVS